MSDTVRYAPQNLPVPQAQDVEQNPPSEAPSPEAQAATAARRGIHVASSAPADSLTKDTTAQISAPIAATASAAPNLPNAQGPAAPLASVKAAVNMSSQSQSGTLSDFEIFAVLQRSANNNMAFDNLLRRQAQASVIASKQQSAKATLKDVDGEQRSAVLKVATGALAAVTSMGMGFKGSQLRSQGAAGIAEGKTAEEMAQMSSRGAMLESSANQAGQLINSFGDLFDQFAWGKKMSNQAKIDKSQADVSSSIAQANLDANKGAFDIDQDVWKNAQQALLSYIQRKADAMNQIGR